MVRSHRKKFLTSCSVLAIMGASRMGYVTSLISLTEKIRTRKKFLTRDKNLGYNEPVKSEGWFLARKEVEDETGK